LVVVVLVQPQTTLKGQTEPTLYLAPLHQRVAAEAVAHLIGTAHQEGRVAAGLDTQETQVMVAQGLPTKATQVAAQAPMARAAVEAGQEEREEMPQAALGGLEFRLALRELLSVVGVAAVDQEATLETAGVEMAPRTPLETTREVLVVL
jgi:hypothetical protein